MKKIILIIIIFIVAAWALQTFTAFKAMDYVNDYWQKIDWSKITVLFGYKKEVNANKQLNIFIKNGRIIPNFNAVETGIKVIWYNQSDKNHTITGEGWGSAEIAPGKAYSKTFNTAGDYKYHCSSHPSETGEIIVK